jgi:predicted DNA-binding transcriptional regulator AlpA
VADLSNASYAALRNHIADLITDIFGIRPPRDTLLAEVLTEAILRETQVSTLTGLSRSTIRRRVREGAFPKPRKLGGDGQQAASGWLASEVIAWMRALEPGDQVEERVEGPEAPTEPTQN